MPTDYEDDRDGYDDRDDDRGRDDDRDRRGRRGLAAARARVGTPGLLLMLSGLVGLLLELGAIGASVAAPTFFYDLMVDMVKNQPPSPEQQKQLKDMEAQKDGMRLDSPLNIASMAVGAVLNVLTVVGGLKMRSLSGYGLAMTGAIAGIVPMGGCCCLTLPFGIWALIVLINPDVKSAFGARGAAASADGD